MGAPQVLLVRILVDVTSIGLDGPATLGGEWSGAFERLSLLLSAELLLLVLSLAVISET